MSIPTDEKDWKQEMKELFDKEVLSMANEEGFVDLKDIGSLRDLMFNLAEQRHENDMDEARLQAGELIDEITSLKADLEIEKKANINQSLIIQRMEKRIRTKLKEDINTLIVGIEPAKKQIGGGQYWRILNEIQKDLEDLKNAEWLTPEGGTTKEASEP